MSPRTATLLLAATLATTAHAATSRTATLAAPTSTVWSSLPWSPAGTPTTGDNASLTSTATSNSDITLTTPYTASTRLGAVTLTGPVTLHQSAAADFYATSLTLNPTSSYALTGGTLSLASLSTTPTSRLNWTAGTLSLTADLSVDSGATPAPFGTSLSITSPAQSLQVHHNLYVGSTATGALTQSAGSVAVTTLLFLGENQGSIGSYSLSGTASLSEPTANIGNVGTGSFTQSGGTHTLSSVLALGGASGFGSYTLSAGNLTDAVTFVGDLGTATFAQTGGTHTITDTLIIAGTDGHGAYSLSAGSLSAQLAYLGGDDYYDGGAGILSIAGPAASATISDTLTVHNTPGTSLRLSAGSLTVGSLDFQSHPENFAFTGGTLTVTAGYTIDPNFAVGATLPLPAGATLASPAPSTNTGTISLTGGSLAGPGTLTNHGLIAGYGTISAPLTNPSTGNILILPASTLSLPNGLATTAGTITLAGGTLDLNHHPLTNTGTIQGHGSLANLPSLTNNGSISITGGALSFTGTLAGTGSLYVDPSSSLDAPAGLAQSLLTTHGPVTLAAPSSLTTLSFPSTTDGSLDLTNASLTTNTPPATLRQYLASHQLRSSTAAADPQHLHTLGYLTTAGITLIKTTFYGDANLDGKIDADDYALLDRGFAQHSTTWQSGDFNYDGIINNQDFLLIDRSLAFQGTPFSPGFLAQREAQFGPDYLTQLFATLPEPTIFLPALFAVFPRRPRR